MATGDITANFSFQVDAGATTVVVSTAGLTGSFGGKGTAGHSPDRNQPRASGSQPGTPETGISGNPEEGTTGS